MNEPFDSTISTAAFTDLSMDRIYRFVKIARGRGFRLPDNSSMGAVLEELRMLRQGRPTNAAVLLFSPDPQRFHPSAVIKCSHFDGTAAGRQPASQELCDGTLFEAMHQAMYFVLSKIVIPGSNGAPSTYEIPVEVVREAISNAVAHRDYFSGACVEVRVYPDRLEVSNPASLPPALTLAQLRQPHDSVSPNPLVAEPLYLTSESESRGNGTNTMISRCRQASLPEPEFKLAGGFLVIVRRQLQPDSAPVGGEDGGQEAPATDSRVLDLVRLLGKAGPLSNADILKSLGLKGRSNLRVRYIDPALAAGLIEPTLPDTPNSRLQKYRLTAKGKALYSSL